VIGLFADIVYFKKEYNLFISSLFHNIMPVEGYVDYKRREFCNDVQCPVQVLLNGQEEGSEQYEKIRDMCKAKCIMSTYDFHHWLIEKGFLIIKPTE
jgi:hypothetical protein